VNNFAAYRSARGGSLTIRSSVSGVSLEAKLKSAAPDVIARHVLGQERAETFTHSKVQSFDLPLRVHPALEH
jgi:hypothetical protein